MAITHDVLDLNIQGPPEPCLPNIRPHCIAAPKTWNLAVKGPPDPGPGPSPPLDMDFTVQGAPGSDIWWPRLRPVQTCSL